RRVIFQAGDGIRDFHVTGVQTCALPISVEDADAAALGQAPVDAPEEVVVELLGRRLLEREDLTARRVDAGHHRADRSVLARRVQIGRASCRDRAEGSGAPGRASTSALAG